MEYCRPQQCSIETANRDLRLAASVLSIYHIERQYRYKKQIDENHQVDHIILPQCKILLTLALRSYFLFLDSFSFLCAQTIRIFSLLFPLELVNCIGLRKGLQLVLNLRQFD